MPEAGAMQKRAITWRQGSPGRRGGSAATLTTASGQPPCLRSRWRLSCPRLSCGGATHGQRSAAEARWWGGGAHHRPRTAPCRPAPGQAPPAAPRRRGRGRSAGAPTQPVPRRCPPPPPWSPCAHAGMVESSWDAQATDRRSRHGQLNSSLERLVLEQRSVAWAFQLNSTTPALVCTQRRRPFFLPLSLPENTHLAGVVDDAVLSGVHVQGAHTGDVGHHAQASQALDGVGTCGGGRGGAGCVCVCVCVCVLGGGGADESTQGKGGGWGCWGGVQMKARWGGQWTGRAARQAGGDGAAAHPWGRRGRRRTPPPWPQSRWGPCRTAGRGGGRRGVMAPWQAAAEGCPIPPPTNGTAITRQLRADRTLVTCA